MPRWTFAFAAAFALLFAGCIDAVLPGAQGRVSGWAAEVEPSMAPNFAGDGDSFPILLVHQHHLMSERQREVQVVCSTTSGQRISLLGPSADSAAMMVCAGPVADAATGRVFVERAAFDAESPDGVVAFMNSCDGGLAFLNADRKEMRVEAPGHTFRVELDAGTFRVDGQRIEPGTALKIAYFIDQGDDRDEQFVRVVFDHPGQWLKSRVAPRGDAEISLPLPPSRGTGLTADVPLSPASLGVILNTTRDATPGTVTGIAALRVVHDGERLTEATIRYATTEGTVTWYGAGRTGDSIRLLGAQAQESGEDSVPFADVVTHFDLPWEVLRGPRQGAMMDLRLDLNKAWPTAAGLAIAVERDIDPVGCDEGCVMIRTTGPLATSNWQRLVVGEVEPAFDALTLEVLAWDAAELDTTTIWWHVAK